MILGGGCCPPTPDPSTFTIDDAQLARLGGGMSEPTPDACHEVCFEKVHGLDASTTDGGPREVVPYYEQAECGVDGHTLRCLWPPQCMPG
jgi:hypothetical protein